MHVRDRWRCQLRVNSGGMAKLTRMRRRGVTVILGALITAVVTVIVLIGIWRSFKGLV